MDMARETVKRNYTVSSSQVTQSMVDAAQDVLTSLMTISDLQEFNDALIRLFTTIPRKMGNVQDHTARKTEDFPRIIQREQDLLDVMRGQIVHKPVQTIDAESPDVSDQTILEALGLEFERCTPNDVAAIKVALGSCSDKYRRAWRVTNHATQQRFDQFISDNHIDDIRLLFHGSRNENWWSILQSGLVLRPTNAVITGKMFGYGLYYAPKARKSLGYTSLSGSYWARGNESRGYMALMNVAYGKPYSVYAFESRLSSFDYRALQRACPGANCLHAHAGKMLQNDEIIIYKEDQCTIKYLVELAN